MRSCPERIFTDVPLGCRRLLDKILLCVDENPFRDSTETLPRVFGQYYRCLPPELQDLLEACLKANAHVTSDGFSAGYSTFCKQDQPHGPLDPRLEAPGCLGHRNSSAGRVFDVGKFHKYSNLGVSVLRHLSSGTRVTHGFPIAAAKLRLVPEKGLPDAMSADIGQLFRTNGHSFSLLRETPCGTGYPSIPKKHKLFIISNMTLRKFSKKGSDEPAQWQRNCHSFHESDGTPVAVACGAGNRGYRMDPKERA